MINLESVSGDPGLVADIACAVDEVLDYTSDYGTSEDTLDYLKWLAAETPKDVNVEMTQVGAQTDADGNEVPLVATSIELMEDGATEYEKDGHMNELSHRKKIKALGRVVLTRPELLRGLGIARIVYIETDRVGADVNDWHKQAEYSAEPFLTYLRGVHRGDEFEWDHAAYVAKDGYRYEPKTESARASQRVIHEVRPDHVFPLHNSGLDSPYAYVHLPTKPLGLEGDMSHFLDTLYKKFPPGIPDTPGVVPMAKYMYGLPSWRELYDMDDEEARDLTRNYGQDAISYANDVLPGPVIGSIVESPYFLPLNARDNRSSGLYHHAERMRILDASSRMSEQTAAWASVVARDASPADQNVAQNVRRLVRSHRKEQDVLRATGVQEPDREWSVSEAASFGCAYHFYQMVPLAMLSNLARRIESPYRKAIDERLEQEHAILQRRVRPVLDKPKRLVQAQLGMFLLTNLAAERTS